MDARVEAMLSPRNSLLLPRRFYSEEEIQPNTPNPSEMGLKNLAKHINGLKKKIKKYEDEFEENFGYRPSHSDKMSNRDIKRLCTELNKLRKEHKLLKEDPISALLANANNRLNTNDSPTNNNNGHEKSRVTSMEEMVKEAEKKLSEKRIKYNRPDNMEELSYEQLLDEKTAVQKTLLHIENSFGRPVSKEDRAVVRPLYDRYRTLKRLLIRAGAVRTHNKLLIKYNLKSIPEKNLKRYISYTCYRAKTRTVYQNWPRFWSMKRWILHRQVCLEIPRKPIGEPASLTCLIEAFWIVSIPRINYQPIAIVNIVAVKAVAAPVKVYTLFHSKLYFLHFILFQIFYYFFLDLFCLFLK